VRNSSYFNQA